MEIDVARPNFQQDFAISVWGSVNKPTIVESTGLASKAYYQYSATPVTPESCTTKANLIQFDGTRKALILTSGCLTRDATFTVNTAFSKVVQYDGAHGSCAATATTCNIVVKAGGAS
jgi:hypothetical protein